MDSNNGPKKFITEDEIEANKKRRQEEWDKVRTAEQPIECPEEDVDPRSLFDRLAEQKQKKEDEFEEKHRLSNQVKGLEEDEVAFLDHVSQRQVELERERSGEEREIFQQMQQTTVVTVDEQKGKRGKQRLANVTANHIKSQNTLLAGALKRKSTDSSQDSRLSANDDRCVSTESDKMPDVNTRDNLPANNGCTDVTRKRVTHIVIRPSALVRVGILPGISVYGNDTSESSDNDSSDMEESTHTQSPYVKTGRQQVEQCE